MEMRGRAGEQRAPHARVGAGGVCCLVGSPEVNVQVCLRNSGNPNCRAETTGEGGCGAGVGGAGRQRLGKHDWQWATIDGVQKRKRRL